MLDKTKKDWWQNAVFYQIYPKSFMDSNGDGIGDIPGILSKLDYLETLGIDGVWLSPVFESPQVDNGYDISNYQAIDSMFGNMEDMKLLISEAKKRGISIILDLVLNHTSNQHPWFQEAIKSKDNPYHDYYIFIDGKEGVYPNDMMATFGGPAYQWVPELNQYYFFQFSPQQPDLNWENPKLREELYKMIRFWIDLGIEGFRLDVIDQIAKVPALKIRNNGPRLHEYLQELSQKAFIHEGIVTVGEAWGANTDNAKLFSNLSGNELSMVFQFEHLCIDQQYEKWNTIPLNLFELKQCFKRWQQGLYNKGWNSLFLNNHDLPRIVSRWGNDATYRVESAKMLAIFLHGMQGTPFIYQGEEIGMTNVKWNMEEYNDLETLNFYHQRRAQGQSHESIMDSIYKRGRDNARTPMQWNNLNNAGFSTNTPWLKVNDNYREINVEQALKDSNSIFYTYQKLIQLRKQYSVFKDGWFELINEYDTDIFEYTRENKQEKILVITNFSNRKKTIWLPEEFVQGEVLISNYEEFKLEDEYVCRPYEAMILLSNRYYE